MYRQLPSRIPGTTLWRHTTPAHLGLDQVRYPVLPDGCVDVIWTGHGLLVAGPDTTTATVRQTPGSVLTGVRFTPGTGPAVLRTPADEIRDQKVPLAALWPQALVRELSERVAQAPEPAIELERLAGNGLRACGAPDPRIAMIVEGARAGATVALIAERTGMSERQLHRRCLTAFGYGAKTLTRILRMDRAVGLARRGVRFAEVAAITGYADQAHLAREIRALAGVPLSQLVDGQHADASPNVPGLGNTPPIPLA